MKNSIHTRKKSTMDNITIKICQVCGIICNKKCNRCKLVYYCGKECQTKDYSLHKKYCKKSEVDKISIEADFFRKLELFRYIVANKEINCSSEQYVYVYTSLNEKCAKVPDKIFLSRYPNSKKVMDCIDRKNNVLFVYEWYIDNEPYSKTAVIKLK